MGLLLSDEGSDRSDRQNLLARDVTVDTAAGMTLSNTRPANEFLFSPETLFKIDQNTWDSKDGFKLKHHLKRQYSHSISFGS